MPKDELKNRVRFSTTLDKEVERKLKDYSKQTMIPISKIVDSAISEYVEKNSKQLYAPGVGVTAGAVPSTALKSLFG